jgi:hypothetical protein
MLLLMLLTPAWSLEVGEAAVSVNEDFKLRYYRDDSVISDELADYDHVFDYVEQFNRINLLANYRHTEVGAQVDEVALFANNYYLNDELQFEHMLIGEGMNSFSGNAFANLEKLWLSQRIGEALTVKVGDGYMSVGRGLALNLVKNTDIDVDTSIRGAQARISAGDWDAVVAAGLANQQQVQADNPNVALRPNMNSIVTAASVQRFGLGPVNLGAHSVAYSFAREYGEIGNNLGQPEQTLDALVAGGTAEAFGILGLDLFFEADYYHYTSSFDGVFESGEAEPGRALYGSAAAYLGPVTLLLEGKDYRNTERLNTFSVSEGFEFATGPTLEYERVITEDSSAAVNSNNITGGRIRADYAAIPGVATPFLMVAVFRDYDLTGLHFNQTVETIVHPVAGIDYFGKNIQTLINVGYRADLRDQVDPETGEPGGEEFDFGADRLAHADVDFRFPLGEKLHGEAIMDFQRFNWGVNEIQQHDFTQLSLTVALGGHGPFSISLFTDYSDNPLIATRGNLDFFGESTTTEPENLSEALASNPPYGAAELQFKPNAASTLRLFYGAYRAGIRCSGGQCRNLPGFEGARLTFNTAF